MPWTCDALLNLYVLDHIPDKLIEHGPRAIPEYTWHKVIYILIVSSRALQNDTAIYIYISLLQFHICQKKPCTPISNIIKYGSFYALIRYIFSTCWIRLRNDHTFRSVGNELERRLGQSWRRIIVSVVSGVHSQQSLMYLFGDILVSLRLFVWFISCEQSCASSCKRLLYEATQMCISRHTDKKVIIC